jgi:hypothetical protein
MRWPRTEDWNQHLRLRIRHKGIITEHIYSIYRTSDNTGEFYKFFIDGYTPKTFEIEKDVIKLWNSIIPFKGTACIRLSHSTKHYGAVYRIVSSII